MRNLPQSFFSVNVTSEIKPRSSFRIFGQRFPVASNVCVNVYYMFCVPYLGASSVHVCEWLGCIFAVGHTTNSPNLTKLAVFPRIVPLTSRSTNIQNIGRWCVNVFSVRIATCRTRQHGSIYDTSDERHTHAETQTHNMFLHNLFSCGDGISHVGA